MECVLRVPAMCGWIGERTDDLQLLDDRAGPSVVHDERQRVFVVRTNVDEMDVEPVDLGDELLYGVQFRLGLAPIVIRRPIAREFLDRGELRALRLIRDGLLFGPLRGRDAAMEVDEILFRNVDAEGSDRDPFPNWTAHSGLLSVDRASIYADEAMVEGGAHDVRLTPSLRLAQRSERRANLRREQFGLFPSGEVTAPIDLVEVGEGAVRPPDPAARGRPDLAGEGGEAHRDRDLGRSLGGRGRDSGGSVALPVRPGRRCPGAGQPVQRNVVEDVGPGEIARGLAVDEGAGDLLVAVRVVVEHP